jgi:hypothetical protein
MDYINFVLRLGQWNAATSTGVAEVAQSPAGEVPPYCFKLDIDGHGSNQRTHRTNASALMVGRRLMESAFTRETLSAWHESYRIALARKRGLRLRLQIDSWELARLPWEMLYDAQRGGFLAFDAHVSVVRYYRLHASAPALRPATSLKVLVAAASPDDLPAISWKREIEVLDNALSALRADQRVEVQHCPHVTLAKLQEALLAGSPNIVHYVGHAHYDTGEQRGYLFLEEESGERARWNAEDAARFFRRYGVNLIVLNACDTATGAWAGLGPALVRAGIPAVVAMQWPVEDQASIRFTQLFYRALALGRTVDECVAEGRLSCGGIQADPNDWAAPVLFLRSTSGRLWVQDISAPDRSQPADTDRSTRAAQCTDDAENGFHFRTHGPLLAAVDGAELMDRAELRRALRLAQQPSVTQYIALLGARQTGKTTLLTRMRDLLRGTYACVLIDLSVMIKQDARACFNYVAFCLLNEVRDLYPEATHLPEVYPIENAIEFVDFMRALAANCPAPRIVVLLDEVGALSPEVSDTFFNALRTIFTQGRTLDKHLARYLFAFGGAIDLYALTFGTISPLNICEKIHLGDLSQADVRTIVGQFARLGVHATGTAAERIHRWTGGHPYLTMRMCALLEASGAREITPKQVDEVAQQMLVEDDNILHVLHELAKRPTERRRLRAIMLEGARQPFTRNDAVLASLEMIGVLRPSQPPTVRNQLYERALHTWFANEEEAPAGVRELDEASEALYARLRDLRQEALTADGTYRADHTWSVLAASLFSLVPAFAVRPEEAPGEPNAGLRLAVSGSADGGQFWSEYGPLIYVARLQVGDDGRRAAIETLLEQASERGAHLVVAMTAGQLRAEQVRGYSGQRGALTLVLVDDDDVAELLETRQDVDAWLRERVLEARRRRL